jgi:hypothetical protein
MKVNLKAITREHMCNALALLALFATATLGASAKYRPDKPSEQSVTVVSHVALSGAPASQMLLRESGDKEYLYIGTISKEGLTVVDVTRPDQPNIIKRLTWPNEASTGRLQMVSGGLALAEGPDSGSAADALRPSTRTMKVIDWSDPANPRAVLSFSGVTSTFVDDARNLVYIANGEGLWILRNNRALAAAAERHVCTTGDAFNEVASCQ